LIRADIKPDEFASLFKAKSKNLLSITTHDRMGIGQRTIGKLNRLISALEEPGFRRQQPKVPPAFMPSLKQDVFPIGAPVGAADLPALTGVHDRVEARTIGH
jgi:hypothetical protein